MRYANVEITTIEVPGEISICFSITGCPLNCDGCHSPSLRDHQSGKFLYDEKFKKILRAYEGLATCVLFMGGEWYKRGLISSISI